MAGPCWNFFFHVSFAISLLGLRVFLGKFIIMVSKCPVCGKGFASKASRKQHTRDAHRAQPSLKHHDHEPPFTGAAGYWMSRENYSGRKSFGWFCCPACSNRWSSAHAWRDYRQGCRRCEEESHPCCLWMNTERHDSRFRHDDDDKPHDVERCEACRQGVCRRGLYDY